MTHKAKDFWITISIYFVVMTVVIYGFLQFLKYLDSTREPELKPNFVSATIVGNTIKIPPNTVNFVPSDSFVYFRNRDNKWMYVGSFDLNTGEVKLVSRDTQWTWRVNPGDTTFDWHVVALSGGPSIEEIHARARYWEQKAFELRARLQKYEYVRPFDLDF